MKNDTLETFDQAWRIRLHAFPERDPAKALQQLLSRLRQDEVDKQFSRIGMRCLSAEHNAVEFDDYRLKIHPIHGVSLGLGPFDGMRVGDRQREFASCQKLCPLGVAASDHRFLGGDFFRYSIAVPRPQACIKPTSNS